MIEANAIDAVNGAISGLSEDERKVTAEREVYPSNIDHRSVKDALDEADRAFGEGNFEEAFGIYTLCAERGDNLSRCRMGIMYSEGLGVDKRPAKAYKMIKASYDPGCPETVFQTGRCLFEGIGVPADCDAGFEMIIAAAETGCAAAENYIARLYLDGRCVEKDTDRGLDWLEKAVSHGHPGAMFELSAILGEGIIANSDLPRSYRLLSESAELGCPEALAKTGCGKLSGGKEEEKAEGIAMLRKAAKLGDGKAAEILGDHYMGDITYPSNVSEAVSFYKTALRNGNRKVLYDLGMHYRYGSTHSNSGRALYYFREGHDGGDVRCSFEYALMLYEGEGAKKDPEKAFGIFLDCAQKGYVRSIRYVGRCYERGQGTCMDGNLAREWYEKGHQKGDPVCTVELAYYYVFGETVNDDASNPELRLRHLKDDARHGLELLGEAFGKGEVHAAYHLGCTYEDNPLVRSVPDALYWYMKGAENGDTGCMMKLAGHYESGAFIEGSEEKAFNLYKKVIRKECSALAAAEMGRCFEEGIHVERDIGTAICWYLKAVWNNGFAMWRLYNIYIGRNETDRAVFWLRRSAAEGCVSAMVELAGLYEYGRIVPKSDRRAVDWYRKASAEGNGFARKRFEELIRSDPQDADDGDYYQNVTRIIGESRGKNGIMELAHDLEEGDILPADPQKARIWYDIAYQLHIKGAKEGLKRVDELIRGEKRISGKQTTLDFILEGNE